MQYALVVVWLAAYLALTLLALPLAAAVFPRFADRGAAFALPLALAVLGVVGYLVGHLAFGWPALLVGLAVLALGSFLVAGGVDLETRPVAEVAVVFAAAFLFLVGVRAFDPTIDPYAGEKFLDYGLLRSLLRAGRLPPEDVWFAGAPVQYYYGGHMIAALLTRLTFTPPAVAYNLALSGFYAAFVTAAWGLAGNVADALGGPRRVAAGLGAFFVALASNLATPARVVLWLLPDGLARPLARALVTAESEAERSEQVAELVAWTPADFSYWPASRVIDGAINEFPLFAWLNGDLHAHMMSPAFLLLFAALCFAYWRTPVDEVGRRRALAFGALPPLAGLLAVVNTWSFPTVLGLVFLTFTFAPAPPASLLPDRFAARLPRARRSDGGDLRTTAPAGRGERWLRRELVRSGLAAGVTAAVLVGAVVWVLPFWLGTASGRSVAFLPERSGLDGLLLVHGAFLAGVVPYLWRRVAAVTDRPKFVAGAAVLSAALLWLAGLAAVALFVPVLVAAWGLLRARRDVGFETVLVVAAVGLILVVEFAYVVEEAGPGRYNTVFKVYSQVWALFAPALGVVLARLATAGRGSLSTPDAAAWRAGGRVLVVVLVFATALYAGLALPQHVANGPAEPTLDGTAWVAASHPAEAEAIAWLDGLSGQPNVASAPGCWCNGYDSGITPYRWANAPASLTGVPTVAGWSHEVGYRNRSAYRTRVAHVRTIFEGSAAEQAALIQRYDVEYIYVGPNEKQLYDPTIGERPFVEPAHESGAVTVYQVVERPEDRGQIGSA